MSYSSSSSTMEIKIVKRSDQPPPSSRFVNTIFINVHGKVNEFVEDQNGIVTRLRSYTTPCFPLIKLYPRKFTPQDIYRLLQPSFDQPRTRICEIMANKIAYECSFLLPGPFGLCFDVTLTRDVRFMLPSVVTPLSKVASDHVLQRLSEEQRVDLVAKAKEEVMTCSICMEDMSESPEKIIKMPNCSHIFHQDCIFEWLKRRNSCPLCRKVPYEEEEQETE